MTNIEKLVKRYFEIVLSERRVLYNYRPNWLKNPKTGHNLELDIYYPKIKFAVEVDGFVHRLSLAQKEKDELKNKICKERGIYLLRITYPGILLKEEFKKALIYMLKKRGAKVHTDNLSYYFCKKLKYYKSKKSRKGFIIKRAINYQNYSILQARETAGNLARMKNKK